jgi:hypothetical protein
MSRDRARTSYPFYPFLFALYPALSLYAYNAEETGVGAVLTPLLASLALVVLVFFVARLAAGNVLKAALIAFVFGLLFFSFGRVFDLFRKPPPALPWILTAAWALVLAGAIVLVVRTRRELGPMTRLLNVFGATLLLVSLLPIAWSHLASLRNRGVRPVDTEDTAILENRIKPPLGYLPDIYFLVFDRYTGSAPLKNYFRFDNGPFLGKLKKRRFATALEARCNIPETYLSLTGTLNMEQIETLFSKRPVRKREVYRLLQDHRVGRLLKSLGYTYYHIGSWYEGTKRNPLADNIFQPRGLTSLSQDFLIKFADSTLLSLALHGRGPVSRDYQHREGVKQQFGRLVDVAGRGGPKFVFLHMLVPHNPFVFGPNGEDVVLDPTRSPAAYYLDQIRFINKRILNVVRTIRRSSRRPPVIILQSDEGAADEEAPRTLYRGLKDRNLKMAKAQVRFGVLNAIAFPMGIPWKIPRGISSVNTFRLVFNRCLGTSYAMLPDTSYKITESKSALKSVEPIPMSFFKFTTRLREKLKD